MLFNNNCTNDDGGENETRLYYRYENDKELESNCLIFNV